MTAPDSPADDSLADELERGRRAVSSSVTAALLLEALRRGRSALSSSTVVPAIRRVVRATGRAAAGSRLADVLRWSERTSRASWLYRWLTAEPDSDVVVIDLRETRTVGPVLAALERVVGPVQRTSARSRVARSTTRISEALAARPVALVSAAVLVAVLAALLASVGLGSPSPRTVGAGLLVASLALAGTRVRVSADELAGTRAYALAVALLEPPEPSGDADSSPGDAEDADSSPGE